MGGDKLEPGNAQSWQSFGKRRPRPETPASGPAEPPVKRSQTVSLVLLAGAGAAVLGLAGLDRARRDEEVLVYPDAQACSAARLRSEVECRSEYDKARTAYPSRAPRYSTLAACETHHGAGHCVAGETLSPPLSGQFVPRMAAFFLGRSAEQAVEPEAVYEHRPEGSSGDAGGYCRSGGGRVTTGGGGLVSVARLASASLNRTSFGGFGSTGRSYSSASRGFFGGG